MMAGQCTVGEQRDQIAHWAMKGYLCLDVRSERSFASTRRGDRTCADEEMGGRTGDRKIIYKFIIISVAKDKTHVEQAAGSARVSREKSVGLGNIILSANQRVPKREEER